MTKAVDSRLYDARTNCLEDNLNQLNDVISGKVKFTFEKIQHLLLTTAIFSDRNAEILLNQFKKEYKEDKKSAVSNIQKTQNGWETLLTNGLSATSQATAAYLAPNNQALTQSLEKVSSASNNWIQSKQTGYQHNKETVEKQDKELSDSLERLSGQRQQFQHQMKENDNRLYDSLSRMLN